MNRLAGRLSLGFLLVLSLTIIPVPEWIAKIKPAWVLLFILYIQAYLPQKFNVFLVFFLGFLLDALLSTVLGEHALALCLVTWLAHSRSRRISFFPLSQQMLFIGFFCLLYQSIILILDAFWGYFTDLFSLFGSALLSTLLWPWIKLLMDYSSKRPQQNKAVKIHLDY